MKKVSLVFIVLCLLVCMIPSVGILFFPTTKSTENKPMSDAPKLLNEDGSFNQQVFSEFETYYTERMGLRNQLLYVDASIQSSVFGESNVSGVICGTDGWLYYASTLDDYLGTNVMSSRELYNLAHNFGLVQTYLDQRNIDFILTIAPNKNSLYGENMPYYKSYTVDSQHSAELLAPCLALENVSYLDLFQLFKEQDEVLYLKQDSHWNNKAACLVYNQLMDAFQLPHEDYSQSAPTLVKNDDGDLKRMLYSFYGELEENYVYDLPDLYTYANFAKSVEDGWIITENPQGSGKLLMFRDSFGNTLIPFFSNAYQTAYYSKGEPNGLEWYVEMYAPDQVIIEKVERNIDNYLNNPPIMTMPEAELPQTITLVNTNSSLTFEVCQNDVNYYKIAGTLDGAYVQEDSTVVVTVNGKVYHAYQTEENGYLAYLKKAELVEPTTEIRVYVVNGDSATCAMTQTVECP